MDKMAKFLESEETKRFRAAIDIWSARMNISRNAVFNISPEYGRKNTWVKDRYYGRVLPKKKDLFWAEKFAISKNLFAKIEQAERANLFVRSIEKMCYSCAGTPLRDPEAVCWDGTCPLRPVSPIMIVNSKESQKNND